MTTFDDQEILHEFVAETMATLDVLDRALVALEGAPRDHERARLVFRSVHNIRGTCGWVALGRMETLAAAAQRLAECVYSAELRYWPEAIRVLFAAVDMLRIMARHVEKYQREPEEDLSEVVARLDLQCVEAESRAMGRRPAQRARGQESAGSAHPGSEVDAEAPMEVDTKGSIEVATPVAIEVDTEEPAPELVPGVRSRKAHDEHAPWQLAQPDREFGKSVRVDVELLDRIMDQVQELVLVRNQIAQFSSGPGGSEFARLGQRLNAVTVDLQESVMKTRMQPMGSVWKRFPRLIRDLALELGKRIQLELEGVDTELDRTLLEAIQDPLLHLVRNAVDHGIEPPDERVRAGKPEEGMIRLRAFHEGGQVNIAVSDDGRGIDTVRVASKALDLGLVSEADLEAMSEEQRLGLIFKPGFSTAASLTHISGRGMGMDVVRSDIQAIGGTIDVVNRPLRGLVFKMRIPLTLAIIPALIVRVAGVRYALPQVSLSELVHLESRARLEYVYDAPVYRLRGSLLTLVHLRGLLGLTEARSDAAAVLVILEADGRRFGLVVDEVLDTEEIVIKPLGRELGSLDCYAGATILGDGSVALILDANGLARRARVTGTRSQQSLERRARAPVHDVESQPLLLFEVGGSRMAMHLSDITRLEECDRMSVEHVGGRDFLQYRESILPLVHVHQLLQERRTHPRTAAAPALTEREVWQIIVHESRGIQVGLVVDAILDIVDTPLDIRMGGTRGGVASTAVIAGRITELLDLERARHFATGAT